MTSKRVKSIVREILCSNVVKTGTGPYTFTCTTVAPHYFGVGDVINDLFFANVPQRVSNITTISGTTGSTIVFTNNDALNGSASGLNINANAMFRCNYYSTSMSGPQDVFTLPIQSGSKALFQSYVVGTGTAVFALEGSLDGVVWSNLATVTHTSSNLDSSAISITDPWIYFRVNITSIGAATKLYLNGVA